MRLLKSFGYAFKGVFAYLRTGGNVTIHIVATVLVIVLGFYFQIDRIEWILLLLCTGMVHAAEAINTSIEKLTDMVSPEFNEKAGYVKDIAAGAVLIISIMAALIGLIIFGPKLLALL